MRQFPLAPEERLALAGYPRLGLAPVGPAAPYVIDRSKLFASRVREAGVPAAPSSAKPSSEVADDWSGSFDMHLGVYTRD